MWNSIASYLNSFQTMLLLLLLTHFGSSSNSAIFVMAYAVSNLMLNIGRYGVRMFQVTDAREKYSFYDYAYARIFSMFLFTVATVLYIAYGIFYNGYTKEKTLVILLLCVFKGIEASEDVLHGRMQQLGRLDVASKILSIRFFVFMFGFAACYLFTKNLLFTVTLNVFISLFFSILLNGSVYRAFHKKEPSTKNSVAKNVKQLLFECLPLALSTIMGMYLCNAPKYTIDGIVSDQVQTCFNIVFMPVFVVALLSNFVFNPYLKRMGSLWANKQILEFKRLAKRLTLVPVAIDCTVLLLGYLFGLKFLGFVYGVDLSPYLFELLVFLIISGVISILNLYAMILTTMRKQKHLLFGYVIGALVMVLCSRQILLQFDLKALCLFYLGTLVFVIFYCIIVAYNAIKKLQ